jgi:hypothetical protein
MELLVWIGCEEATAGNPLSRHVPVHNGTQFHKRAEPGGKLLVYFREPIEVVVSHDHGPGSHHRPRQFFLLQANFEALFAQIRCTHVRHIHIRYMHDRNIDTRHSTAQGSAGRCLLVGVLFKNVKSAARHSKPLDPSETITRKWGNK